MSGDWSVEVRDLLREELSLHEADVLTEVIDKMRYGTYSQTLMGVAELLVLIATEQMPDMLDSDLASTILIDSTQEVTILRKSDPDARLRMMEMVSMSVTNTQSETEGK